MHRLMTSAALALCLGVISHAAEARQWWAVDYSNNTCHQPVINGQLFTPDQFERALRADSTIQGPPEIFVKKDDYGNVLGVSITATYNTGNKSVVYFATSYAICEALRQELVREGQLTLAAICNRRAAMRR